MTQNHAVEAAAMGLRWAEMDINQKAAFLEGVARRLSRLGDILGAETARTWAFSVLEQELRQRPTISLKDPVPEVPPREMIDRLWEVIEWTRTVRGGEYLSASVLRDSCHYLIDVARQQER